MNPDRAVRVYGLLDARDPEQRIRYVGQTSTRVSDRLNRHRYAARKPDGRGLVTAWMREIGPEYVVAIELEVCTWTDRHEREAWWIDEKRTLVELNEGGLNDSHGSRMSARDSARRAKVWSSPDERQRRIDSARKTLLSPKVNERVRAGNLAANHSRWHVTRGVRKDGCVHCEKS